MVIVDSPGICDSEQTNKIALDYLPQAYAFIYVLNSSNAGGLQEDRVSKKVNEVTLYHHMVWTSDDRVVGVRTDYALLYR